MGGRETVKEIDSAVRVRIDFSTSGLSVRESSEMFPSFI